MHTSRPCNRLHNAGTKLLLPALTPPGVLPAAARGLEHLEFGALGKGKDPFSDATYLRLNWPTALKSFTDGAKSTFQYTGKPPATTREATIIGTAGKDCAGEIAADASGNVCQAVAVEGSLEGQPYAGGISSGLPTRTSPSAHR